MLCKSNKTFSLYIKYTVHITISFLVTPQDILQPKLTKVPYILIKSCPQKCVMLSNV